MKILLLIVAIVYVISSTMTGHFYKTYTVNQHPKMVWQARASEHKFGWFVGTLVATAIEANCWWYIIDTLIAH